LLLIKDFWATKIKAEENFYPEEFTYYILPIYILLWLVSGYFSGAYDKPFKTKKVFKSVVFGTLTIAAIYGFLPDDLRFSRAIIVIGAAWTFISMLIIRFIYNFIKHKKASFEINENKNIAIIGSGNEMQRVLNLLKQTNDKVNFIGFVSSKTNTKEDVLGNIEELQDLISLYDINELIFCAKNVSSKEVMKLITEMGNSLSYKIVPPESMSIIGSDSKNTAGDLYAIDLNLAIASTRSKQMKRIFDVIVSIFLLLSLPFNIWFVRTKTNYIKNIFRVLFAKRTWVSYVSTSSKKYNLPIIKKGIINPMLVYGIEDKNSINKDRINLLYAKDYTIEKDFFYLLKAFKELGNEF